ncbi:MAG: hypothetical protein J6583_08975 [Gilliamella sp.]|nr:hypothetical protein [Gilliamella sp.]
MNLFTPLTSKNAFYKTISHGIKYLVKVNKLIKDKLRRQIKDYNKSYLGELLYVNTKHPFWVFHL